MRVHDVIIVGAGPAGSALAIRLARDGYGVLLLEKHRFPRDKVCGDLVSARGLKGLADLGCAAEIERRAFLPVAECGVYVDDELLIEAEMPRLPGLPPSGHAVPRVKLDEILFRAALAAGAHAVEGCTVLAHDVEPSAVRIVAERNGRRRTFRGRVVVGADGAGSVVARTAGLEMRDARYVQLAMRAYCTGLPRRQAALFFSEEFFPGYGWFFPIRDGAANVGVGMVKESAQRDRLQLKRFFARFVEHVRRWAAEHGTPIEITRAAGWPIKTYGGASKNFFERGLLIGDAGCFVDPISGEGIPLALQSAELAAETIRDAYASGDFGAGALASFERRWRARYDADLGVSDLVVSAIRNRHLVKVWMHCLRVIAMTARRDRDYASRLGGILAGLVPAREGLAPDIVSKSLLHGPAFWLEAFGLAPHELRPTDWLGRAVALVEAETRRIASTPGEAGRLVGWTAELVFKQLEVMQALAAGGGRDPRPSP